MPFLLRYAKSFFLAIFLACLSPGFSQYHEDPEAIFEPGIKESFPHALDALRGSTLSDGALSVTVSGGDDRARALVVQTDGKVVIGGYGNSGANDDFALVRIFPDGVLDTSFATSGISVNTIGTASDIIHSMALQTDGKVVATGRAYFTNYQFTVVRYQTDGKLDTSFNTIGRVVTTVLDNMNFSRAVLISTDAKLTVGGFSWWYDRYNYALARYQSNGTLDTSFYTIGYLVTKSLSTSPNGILAMDFYTNGIVGVGPIGNATDLDFGFVRYLSNGDLDTTFHTDGSAVQSFLADDDRNTSVAVTSTGEIISVGYVNNGANNDIAVMRLKSNGTLDTSFSTDGKDSRAIGGQNDEAFAIRLETGGKFFVAGYSNNGSDNDFALIRYQNDGSLDTTFNSTGINTVAVNNGDDTGLAMAVMGGSYIYVAGRTFNGASYDFGVARFSTDGSRAQGGSVDFSFGTGGNTQTNLGGTDTGRAALVQTDGKIVTFGTSNSNNFAIVRYLMAGSLDTSFHTDGFNVADITTDVGYAVALQTDGLLVGAGKENADATLIRFMVDGGLDTAFSTDGKAVYDMASTNGDTFRAVVIQTDGKIVAGGSYWGGANQTDWLVVRVEANGTLDTSFNTSGKLGYAFGASNDTCYSLSLESTGKILCIGGSGASGTYSGIRLLTDGSFDTTFGTDGAQAVSNGGGSGAPVASLIRPETGQIVMFGDIGGQFVVARFASSGAMDTSFSTDGKVSSNKGASGRAMVEASGDSVYIFGDTGGDFVLGRVLSNGTFDTSFDTDGFRNTNVNGTDNGYALVKMLDGRICGVGISNNDYATVCFLP